MTASISDDVLDDIVEHEVQLRRAIGSEQRKVAARLNLVEKEVIARFLANPPRTESGVLQFEKRIRKVIRSAYRDQDKAFKAALRTVARTENDAVNGAVERQVND
jgi:hypothetical protein